MAKKRKKRITRDIHEDIYILEAVKLERISYVDGILRFIAVEIDSRLAYFIVDGQIDYMSRNTAFLDLYPDPKQVSVQRMLLSDGTLRQIRLLDAALKQELYDFWLNLQLRKDNPEKLEEIDNRKHVEVLMDCSNTAFESSMDEKLIPKPGQTSVYWERMVKVADSWKGLNTLQYFLF